MNLILDVDFYPLSEILLGRLSDKIGSKKNNCVMAIARVLPLKIVVTN